MTHSFPQYENFSDYSSLMVLWYYHIQEEVRCQFKTKTELLWWTIVVTDLCILLISVKTPEKAFFIFVKNKKTYVRSIYLVRMKGLEPSRPKALAPKASVSTNSTTSAYLVTE